MLLNDKDLQIRQYPVNKDFGDDEPFFRIQTEIGEIQLPKIQFQIGKPLPDTLSCRVKYVPGKAPYISHNMPMYVSEFYADGFSKGEEFEFKVISTWEGQKGIYRLIDDNGLIFKLHETKTTLTKGQSVKCRFEALSPTYFILRRSTNDIKLPMLTLGDMARVAAVHGVNAVRLDGYLQQIPQLTQAMDELNHGHPIWVMTAIRAIRQLMPRIFQTAIETMTHEAILDMIKGYERILMYLLQGSGFLRNVRGAERSQLQGELTSQIEQLDIYQSTLKVITNHEEGKFIDNLLYNLKESGYLYHPTTQFSIMMILFRLSPHLVNSSLGKIYDTIMGWEPETWKTEPFRQAFVEQLEMYITETREVIDQFLQAETAADNEVVEKVLTAIAIQHALATAKDTVDTRINTSLFYRYLSLLRSTKADVLLNKSYLALMGVQLPTDYTWSDIKEPTMMMTRAAVDPPSTAVLPPSTRYYISDDIEVEVGPEGISIGKIYSDANNALPNGMLPWPGLRVNVERTINRQKMKTMEGHAEFWADIETDLFVDDANTTEQISTRRIPDIDDTVRIIVERVIPSAKDSNKIQAFECMIVDDHFVAERGILPAENVVNWNLHGVTAGTFRHDNGDHMVFEAQIVDFDENDTLIFSLQDQAHQAVRDIATTGEKCYCVVTKDNGRSYSAISELGFGLYVNKEDDDLPPFHRGNVLKVMVTGFSNEAIQSVVVEGPVDGHPFSNARAFRNLLLAICVHDDNDKSDDVQIDEDDMMPREDIHEIIEILRYRAISSRDNILMAFDYLSYARLLALIIADEKLADTIKAHKEILLLHQHYAKNKSLYAEDIERIVQIAPDSILIRRMASRLKVVASLGHSEDNGALWEIANSAVNDTEKELAQMVLSYNMLYDINHDDPTAATIKDKIAQTLNVDSQQRTLKYYGTESQYVEFKSSLVYPAQKGKAGISMADPDKQEYEILHIIAGFLNTTGGTLYIGVNDDHYERGLEDDFSFYRMDQSERNTRYRRSIKNLDNLANYLQNLIDSSFSLGKNAGDYAKASIDEESVKGVIAVKIEPCPHIVYLNNNIYVRHSAKTEPLTRKEEIDIFTADRKRLYNQLVQAAASTKEVQETETAPTPVVKASEAPAEKKTEVTVAEATNGFEIATSKIRNNILHDYDDPDHFVQPLLYIRFTDDNHYVVTKDEWSIDTENDRLILTVTDDEIDDYLLLVYDNEYAIKVKIKELAGKMENVSMPHYPGRKLIYACPVSANGGLYSLHCNSKNTLYERVTPIDRITQGNMSTAPERIIDIDAGDTVMYETVKPDKMTEMSSILSTVMKRTQIGSLVKGVSSVKTSIEDAVTNAIKRLQ